MDFEHMEPYVDLGLWRLVYGCEYWHDQMRKAWHTNFDYQRMAYCAERLQEFARVTAQAAHQAADEES